MSNEITYTDADLTGDTLHALVYQAEGGSVWNTGTTAYETYDAGSYADYLVTVTESPAGTFNGDMPADVPVGTPWCVLVRQLGASPADGDPEVAAGPVEWFGPASSDPAPSDCGTDRMSAAVTWLTSQLQTYRSSPVTYQRGNTKVAVCASFGRKLFKLSDGMGGVVMEWTDKDFYVPAASLVIGGSVVLPQRGDLIVETVAGKKTTYEAFAPGGEPCWSWVDPYRKLLRIHGKQVSEVDA